MGLPALAALAAWPLSADGAAGVFQTALAGLVVVVGVAAFLVRSRRWDLAALGAACVLLALVHALRAGSLAGAPALFLLAAGVCTAAAGLAACGRALGTPALTAGTAAGAVLWVAMCGLMWADDLAEALPRERRPAFRQAVLHLDAATACAYDVADFDRFHDPLVYRKVPLAASLVRAPAAPPTALAWFVLGVLAWGAGGALCCARRPAADA